MNLLKLCSLVFFLIISGVSFAQEKKYYISDPTDLPHVGWNKVLCMKNGNTMLFHFEPDKRITVKVFDSLHKEIASQGHLCRIIDVHIIKEALFKGLFDLNGEAVLFLEQEHQSKNQLVRLRFNSNDGTLIEEKLLGESESISKRTKFFVMKNKVDDNYAVLFSTDVSQFKQCTVHLVTYNKVHEPVKDIPLEIDRKKYDYLDVIGAESQPNGIFITLSLSRLQTNGTASNLAGSYGTAELYDHDLTMFYIARDSSRAMKSMIDVTTDTYPYYSNYTYNAFSKTLNLLLFSYQDVLYRFGTELRPDAVMADIFFKLDESTLSLDHNRIKNKMATSYLKQKVDTNKKFDGVPLQVFTNENGLSTMISQSYSRYTEKLATVNVNTYLSYIGITQFDDDGNEIWGTVLPFYQNFMSHSHYYPPIQFSKRWQEQPMLGDLPPQVYERQFFSVNTYSIGRDFFIVYNDYNKNFNNSIEHPGDTVYEYATTNACYYKMNRKKEITKNYLFGDPAPNEYKASFIEGADFDEQRGTYATLIQCRKNDKTTLCMAWSKLD